MGSRTATDVIQVAKEEIRGGHNLPTPARRGIPAHPNPRPFPRAPGGNSGISITAPCSTG
jgi:hypothetical protein